MSANELRELRRRLGWSQNQLAREIGTTEHTVRRWEMDPANVHSRHPGGTTVTLLRRIAAEHGVDPATLSGVA